MSKLKLKAKILACALCVQPYQRVRTSEQLGVDLECKRKNGSELSAWKFETDACFHIWIETRFQELVTSMNG